jgi:hypothetical protein
MASVKVVGIVEGVWTMRGLATLKVSSDSPARCEGGLGLRSFCAGDGI